MINKKPIKSHQSTVKDINLEKEYLSINTKLIKKLKNEFIEDIEYLKQAFLKKNSSKYIREIYDERDDVSVVMRENIVDDLDRDISLIQNKCDIICNDLVQLNSNMDERLVLVNKNDFITNILNYKLYEIQYNFSTKVKELEQIKKEIENTKITKANESKVALNFVENQRDIKECELTYEQQQKSVKQQLLESQEKYKKSANVIEDCLDVMKKNITNLIAVLKEHKHCSNSSLEGKMELSQLQDMLNGSTKLQLHSQNFTNNLVVGFRLFCTHIVRKCQASCNTCYEK